MRAYLTILLLLLILPQTLAGEIKIDPDHVLIPIGGNNSTRITFVLYDDDGIQENHSIFLKFFNESGVLTEVITGRLDSDEVELEKEPSSFGILKYTWKPESAGSYNFTLTLWFSENVTVNENFDVFIEDKYVYAERPKITATGYADVVAIPELLTALLVVAGLTFLFCALRMNCAEDGNKASGNNPAQRGSK